MSAQRAAFMVAGSVPVAMAAVACADLARRPSEQVGLRRSLWVSVVTAMFVDWMVLLRWGGVAVSRDGEA